MADWPDTDELKQVLNVDTEGDDWSLTLDRVLASAIATVKEDVGDWDDAVDEPDDRLAQAALRMAELMALKPEVVAGLGSRSTPMAAVRGDPTYMALLYGHRRRFGLA